MRPLKQDRGVNGKLFSTFLALLYTNTAQFGINGESCWETFFRHYSDRIYFDIDGDSVRDQITDDNNNGIIDIFESYVPISGPVLSTEGAYTIVEVNNG